MSNNGKAKTFYHEIMVVWHNTVLQCGKNGRGQVNIFWYVLCVVYCLLGPKILVMPLPICNFAHSLAHDYNGLVARAHLHLLHQISHLQYTCGRLWHTILRPPHVLELSHSEASLTDRHCCLVLDDAHLSDDVIIGVLLRLQSDRVLAIRLTATFTMGPIVVANFLHRVH